MKIKFFLGILISIIFLYLALRNVSLVKLLHSIERTHYLYLILIMFLVLLAMWLRAIRWRYLLEPIKKIETHSLFSAVMIGFMANNVLPARIGEFVRAYAIGRKENLSKSLSFATIVFERIFDGFILSFLLLILIFFPLPNWVKKAGISVVALQLIVIIFLITLKRHRQSVLKIIQSLLSPVSKRLSRRTNEVLTSFSCGFEALKGKKQIAIVLFYSLCIWMVQAFLTFFLFRSFKFTLPFYAPVLLIVIIAFAVMIPSSPGFVGTFQFFCVTGLTFWGISESEALGFSIVYHASQYFPVTFLGLFYLWKENLSIKDIRKVGKETDDDLCQEL